MDKAAKARLRQEQTPAAKEAAKEKQKAAMAKSRAAQTAEEREAINKNLQAARSKQAPAVREAAKEKQKAAMAKSRGKTRERAVGVESCTIDA